MTNIPSDGTDSMSSSRKDTRLSLSCFKMAISEDILFCIQREVFKIIYFKSLYLVRKMSKFKILLERTCCICETVFHDDNFAEIEFEKCPGCSKKNVCEVCKGKKGRYNYENEYPGKRCKRHPLPGMIDIFKPEYAAKRFDKNIRELGGEVIGKYTTTGTPTECICGNGHKCNPTPGHIQQGCGMCTICSGKDFQTSKENFHTNIKNLGGEVIGEYGGSTIPVKCKCKDGHECYPIPSYIQQGGGMCLPCSGKDPKIAGENFCENIRKMGGEVLDKYIDSGTRIKCRCKDGHECYPLPHSIKKGFGMCLICIERDPIVARENFYKNIELLGGEVVGKHVNSRTLVLCKCKNGHECNVNPRYIQQGGGMCARCAGKDTIAACENFYENIRLLEGEVLGEYIDNGTPVPCRCKNGHECNPTPNSIQQGHGMCSVCKNKTEKKLLKYLTDILKLPVSHQQKFDWCVSQKTGRKYRYDFWVSLV